MNALKRKDVEQALVAELRRQRAFHLAAPNQANRGAAGGKPNMREIRLAIAAETGGCTPAELAAAVQSLRYAGKIAWDAIALSDSMITNGAEQETPAAPEGGAGSRPTDGAPPSSPDPAPPEWAPADGPEANCAASGPDDEDDEDYPGGVNDAEAARPAPQRSPPGGWRKASNIGGARPSPAPAHETEVQRSIREQAADTVARRRLARSTGTVSHPLELRKFGVPDMDFAEGVASLLVEEPKDLIAAVTRKHPQLWRRVILLGRRAGKRPAEVLFEALEAGLDAIERNVNEDEQTEDMRDVA